MARSRAPTSRSGHPRCSTSCSRAAQRMAARSINGRDQLPARGARSRRNRSTSSRRGRLVPASLDRRERGVVPGSVGRQRSFDRAQLGRQAGAPGQNECLQYASKPTIPVAEGVDRDEMEVRHRCDDDRVHRVLGACQPVDDLVEERGDGVGRWADVASPIPLGAVDRDGCGPPRPGRAAGWNAQTSKCGSSTTRSSERRPDRRRGPPRGACLGVGGVGSGIGVGMVNGEPGRDICRRRERDVEPLDGDGTPAAAMRARRRSGADPGAEPGDIERDPRVERRDVREASPKIGVRTGGRVDHGHEVYDYSSIRVFE